MGEDVCAIHADRSAVGKCSLCKKSFCLDCLDVDTGETLCPDCLKVKKTYSTGEAPSVPKAVPTPAPAPLPEKAPPSAPTPPPAPKPSASPLDFSGKGMDDDPLGLFGGGGTPPIKPPMPSLAPKPEAAKVEPIPAAKPVLPPEPKAAPSAPPPSAPALDPLNLLGGGASKPVKPFGTAPEGSLPPMSYPLGSISGVQETSKAKKNLVNAKIWSKYLLRRAYGSFDPLAKKLRVPTFVVVAAIPLLAIGALLGGASLLRPSPVKILKDLPPLHVMRIRSAQVGELDVTTLAELQQRIRALGFSSLTQATLPELPSPNFLDVWMKSEAGTYAEILKFPGQVIPQLSFVTVFNNGVWCSTNAWKGTDQELPVLHSRFRPGEAPDKLYVQHIQTIEKLRKDKGWQVQYMGEARYFAALSDHLRWFFVERKLQPYKAQFDVWH